MKLHEWAMLLLFPPRCPGCGQLLPALSYAAARRSLPLLCDNCREIWEKETIAACPACGTPMFKCTCIPKICSDNGCVAARKLFCYHPHHTGLCTSRVIFALKERLTKRVTVGIAEAFLPAVREICAQNGIDSSHAVITYLPRRNVARASHGYDQAEKTASAIAKASGASIMPLLARARRSTGKAQKKMGRADRLKAAAASFVPTHKKLPAGTGVLLLVDDIITTGSGVAACSAILKKEYGLPIYALVLGMTY